MAKLTGRSKGLRYKYQKNSDLRKKYNPETIRTDFLYDLFPEIWEEKRKKIMGEKNDE